MEKINSNRKISIERIFNAVAKVIFLIFCIVFSYGIYMHFTKASQIILAIILPFGIIGGTFKIIIWHADYEEFMLPPMPTPPILKTKG